MRWPRLVPFFYTTNWACLVACNFGLFTGRSHLTFCAGRLPLYREDCIISISLEALWDHIVRIASWRGIALCGSHRTDRIVWIAPWDRIVQIVTLCGSHRADCVGFYRADYLVGSHREDWLVGSHREYCIMRSHRANCVMRMHPFQLFP